LRKENREFIELARSKPLTEEGKERMKILRQDIEQFGVSEIKKKKNTIFDIY
jgi:hypothetical protein